MSATDATLGRGRRGLNLRKGTLWDGGSELGMKLDLGRNEGSKSCLEYNRRDGW